MFATMNGTSLLWIAPSLPGGDAKVRRLRAAGFFPVAVPTVDGALHLLSQFRAGLVLLHIANGGGVEGCARLIASGSPVAVAIDLIHKEAIERYLNAGCSAVIDSACTADKLAAALARVAAGERGLAM
jgi:DNA-binding NarL/FixJ family response regulator